MPALKLIANCLNGEGVIGIPGKQDQKVINSYEHANSPIQQSRGPGVNMLVDSTLLSFFPNA